MSNKKELRKYRERARNAALTLEEVEALPRKVGSLVRWGEKGVVWQRAGDDSWVPLHESNDYKPVEEYGTFPSDHVAMTSQGWTPLKGLPGQERTDVKP